MKKLCVTAIALMFMFGLGFGSNSALADEVPDETEVSNEAPADCGAYHEKAPIEELNCGNPGEKPDDMIEAGQDGFCGVEGWSSNGPFTMCFPTPDGDLDGWYDGEGNLVASASGEPTEVPDETDPLTEPSEEDQPVVEPTEEAELDDESSNASQPEQSEVSTEAPSSTNTDDLSLGDGNGSPPAMSHLDVAPEAAPATLGDGTVVNALPATGVGPDPQSSLTEGQREFLIWAVGLILAAAVVWFAATIWANHTVSKESQGHPRD